MFCLVVSVHIRHRLSRSSRSKNKKSRHTAQAHMSVTQLMDDNSLLETTVRTLRDKLVQAQQDNMTSLRTNYESERRELVAKYTAAVEDLEMNCKLQVRPNTYHDGSVASPCWSLLEAGPLTVCCLVLGAKRAGKWQSVQPSELGGRRAHATVAPAPEDPRTNAVGASGPEGSE